VEVVLDVWNQRQIQGLQLISGAPFLRHFTARLAPLTHS
jgi:tryptophanase